MSRTSEVSILWDDHEPAPDTGDTEPQAEADTDATSSAAASVIPLRPSKPGPPGDWDDVAADDLRLRRVAELVTQGKSYRQIASDLGIAYSTVQRLAPQVHELMTEETRQLAADWSMLAFLRLEKIGERLLPHLIADDDYDTTDGPEPAPDPKGVASFARIVKTQLTVLNLSRQRGFAEEAADGESVAEQTVANVERYIELATKMVTGVLKAGYGSGVYDGPDAYDDELDAATARADSGMAEDPSVTEPTDTDEDELDDPPGAWRDGRFYPLSS